MASLWATHSPLLRGFRERVLPRDTVELMINFGGEQRLHLSGGRLESFHRAWVSGLHSACIDIESPSAPELVAASLRPAFAASVLDCPGDQLTGKVASLDGILGRAALELAGRLEECPSVTGRFLLLEDFLRDRLRRGRAPTPSVARAALRLVESGGQLPIHTLCEELRCSPRHLQQRMAREVGFSPKHFARLLRFARAVERIRGQSGVDWTGVAAECGYFDQSHFHRDFVEFCGVTPSAFLALRDESSQAIVAD